MAILPYYIMKYLERIACNSCEEISAWVVWDDRYKGYRGVCGKCEGNWPESWWLQTGS